MFEASACLFSLRFFFTWSIFTAWCFCNVSITLLAKLSVVNGVGTYGLKLIYVRKEVLLISKPKFNYMNQKGLIIYLLKIRTFYEWMISLMRLRSNLITPNLISKAPSKMHTLKKSYWFQNAIC